MRSKKAYMALKLDIEKVYDRIEWTFLWKTLSELGFHKQWIEWLRECVTTVSYSLSINNQACGFLKPSRGLR